jgi:fatty-acyl-CoA synthase
MKLITEKEVIALIKNTLPNITDIPATVSFTQSGLLTSMDLVNLIFEIENEFNVEFDLDALDLKLFDSPIMIADTVNNMRGANDLTLKTLIDEICGQNPKKPALTFDAETLTYEELYGSIRRLASGFLDRGIDRGTHVIIILDNCLEYILSYLSLFYIGAIPIPINTRWNSTEAVKVILDSDGHYFIVREHSGRLVFTDIAKALANAGHKIEQIISCQASNDEKSDFNVLAQHKIVEFSNDINGSDIAMISYTSGTTGNPKGVMLRHCDIAKISLYTEQIWANPTDESFSIAPLYSAQGFLSLLINFSTGSRFKMISSFNTNDILREISKGTETFFHTQPTMWTMLLNSRIINFADFSGLHKVVVSGSLCSPELARRIEERLHCNLLNAYGLIEGTSVVTITRCDDTENVRLNTVGRPIPGVEIKIVDSERKPVPHGEIGELAIRGYVMAGYYKNEQKTKEIMDDDGWLYTGDLARYYDNENISIVGRCKEMIIRGGYNVYPSDIEEVILQLPQVQTAAVVGRSHEVLGEELVAFVVQRAGESLQKTDISRYVFANIANYKQPDHIFLISDMPTILAGKIDKKVLSDWAQNGIPSDKQMLFIE